MGIITFPKCSEVTNIVKLFPRTFCRYGQACRNLGKTVVESPFKGVTKW